jgi:anti-sigma B factor antagonist
MTKHARKPSDGPLLMPPSASASFDALGLRVEIRPGVPAVAEVSGDVDIVTAPWLRETLLLAIQRYGPAISVDLQGVTFLDCAGVNALLATERRARVEGGQVQVTRSSAPAWRVISLLGLVAVLDGGLAAAQAAQRDQPPHGGVHSGPFAARPMV